MRITAIDAIPISIPLSRTFSGSGYHVDTRCTVITRITTDEGVVGRIYNGDNRHHGREIVRIIHEELAPLLVGEDAFAIERHWERMFRISYPNRDHKLVMEAIACVDSALWDTVGRRLGVNVGRLLGGYRSRMPIIAIAGYYEAGKTLADLEEEMRRLKSVGMAGCKMKVGGLSPAEDAERVAAARAGGGDDFVLAVDANRGWTRREAIEFAGRIAHLNIEWFEEPCHWYDEAAGMAAVRARTAIPITAGQSEMTLQGVRRLVDAGSVDLVNFDASEGGGVTEWRRIAGLCAAHDVLLAHHEEPQIAMQLLSAVPHGTYVECFPDRVRDPIWADLIVNRPDPEEGWIEVPQGAGFGLEFDDELIERFRIDR